MTCHPASVYARYVDDDLPPEERRSDLGRLLESQLYAWMLLHVGAGFVRGMAAHLLAPGLLAVRADTPCEAPAAPLREPLESAGPAETCEATCARAAAAAGARLRRACHLFSPRRHSPSSRGGGMMVDYKNDELSRTDQPIHEEPDTNDCEQVDEERSAEEASDPDDESTHEEPAASPSPDGPCIWAVGGGKGGVGKSMVTTSLAVALAGRGQRVVVVDADLGGANVDTVFGISRPAHTLSEFFAGEVSRLEEVLSPTSVPNLRVVSGSNALLSMANPLYSQKAKFLRHLRYLPVDHVLLDLGAGSSYNVLDFFLAARKGIVVVVPEPTSIENAYYFLKAAFFRSLRAVARNAAVNAALSRVLDERIKRRVRSPLDLIAGVMEIDPAAGQVLRQRARAFAPRLIVNQVRNDEQRALGNKIVHVCREHMGTQIEDLGYLEHDQHVIDAVHHRKPVLQLHPTCNFARGVRRIVERMLRGTPAPIDSLSITLPPLDVSHPGAYLRSCREALGVELGQMMERTQIRSLEALEEERFECLPPGPYVRNFVLAYARELGIREADLLAASYAKRFRHALDGSPARAS